MFLQFSWPAVAVAPTHFAESESYPWIQVAWLHVNYTVGIDGISLVLILLTGILQAVTVAYSWNEPKQPGAWFGLVLLTCSAASASSSRSTSSCSSSSGRSSSSRCSSSSGTGAGPWRRYAALKFFIYTHVASVTMLVALLVTAFYSHSPSLDFASLAGSGLRRWPCRPRSCSSSRSSSGSASSSRSFRSTPGCPTPHVEAPTGAARCCLAGLLLKLGGYGLIRRGLEILPTGLDARGARSSTRSPSPPSSGAPGVSLAQRDLKRLVAYSSINHMGIVLLAIALYSSLGLLGRGPPDVRPRDRERAPVHGLGKCPPHVREPRPRVGERDHAHRPDALHDDDGGRARVVGPARRSSASRRSSPPCWRPGTSSATGC